MSVRRSLAWAFSGQFASFVIQFAGSIVIARLLSPHEVGIYAIAMAAIGIVQVVTGFGISAYIVREVDLPVGTLESAFTVNAILVAGLSLLLTGLSFVTGPLLGVAEAGSVLQMVALANLFGIVTFRPSAMMQRAMQFKHLSLIAVLSGIVQTTATIAFALSGASYMSPAYASLASGLAGMLLTLVFGHRYTGFRFSLVGWRPITTFGLQMMSVSGVAMLASRLSDLILGRLLGVAALGLYARASNLSNMIFENVYGTATRVVFVQLSKEYREGGDWQNVFVRSFSLITAFMWPFLIGLAILSRPAIFILYGERWLPAAWPLSALLIAQFFVVAFGMNWELFVIRGETGRQSRFEIARMAFGLPAFAIGCLFSILAAAVGKIVEAVVGLIVYYPHVRRLAEIGPYEVPTIYRDSAALTAVAVLPSLGVMLRYNWSPRTPFPIIAGAVAMGLAMWLALIIIMGHPLRDELLALKRRFRAAQPATL